MTVTYNSADVLPGLLESLDEGMTGLEWQLVVADNASTDGTSAFVREHVQFATLVQTGRNAGYAAGINAGVGAAKPFDAVLVVNPDVRLHHGCGAALVAAITSEGAGLAIPRLLGARGELILSMRREPTVLRAWGEALAGARRAGRRARWGETVSDPAAYDRGCCRVDWGEGSTVMIGADCWRRCGSWDESFFLYSEETEYALRARDLGFATVYVPYAVATHLEGGSAGCLRLMLLVNKVRLFRRRNGRLRAGAFWAAILWREASQALIGRARSRHAVRALLNPRLLTDAPGPHWLAQ